MNSGNLEQIKKDLQPAIDALARLGFSSTIVVKDAFLHVEPRVNEGNIREDCDEEDHQEKNDRP